jgi:hypothetical protein
LTEIYNATPEFRKARAADILTLQGFTECKDGSWVTDRTIATITDEPTMEHPSHWSERVKPGYIIQYRTRK